MMELFQIRGLHIACSVLQDQSTRQNLENPDGTSWCCTNILRAADVLLVLSLTFCSLTVSLDLKISVCRSEVTCPSVSANQEADSRSHGALTDRISSHEGVHWRSNRKCEPPGLPVG
ncbi:hypothetical protein XENORESO_012414, partial [Xenotaenia resolanae]